MSESKQRGVIIVGAGGVVTGDQAIAVGERGVAIHGDGNIISGSKPRLSVLFIPSTPTEASQLKINEEFREIQENLQTAKLQNQLELHLRMSPRPTDVSQGLLDLQPEIVHFAGHGTSIEGLHFENQSGVIQIIQPEFLAALFSTFSSKVKLVVLDACYSADQAEAIAEHVEYVIGISREMSDEAAIAFTTGFYQALGTGRTIEEAYKLGCTQIRLLGTPEHLSPILKKRLSGISPNLYRALRASLIKCQEFQSYTSLRSVFVGQELTPWRYGVPEADSLATRVDSIIMYLSSKFNASGENALVLLLHALSDRYAPDNALNQELRKLAEELTATVKV